MAEAAATTQDTTMELATFYVGKALCGIDILTIQEINKHFDVTTVPQAADYVVGVLNLRGRIVTVLDLGKKLGLSEIEKNRNNKNIIVRSQDELIGLMVDSISDVVTAECTSIEHSPSNISGVKGKYFKGVLKTETSLIGILDVEEVLKD
jgi:purine-binding chemotaxis protein CheW